MVQLRAKRQQSFVILNALDREYRYRINVCTVQQGTHTGLSRVTGMERKVVPEGILLSYLPADTITHEDGRLRAVSCCDHGNSH